MSLPNEILIDILTMLPWSRAGSRDTRLVCRQFNAVLRDYEHSIACELIRTQFPASSRRRFPGLFHTETVNYAVVDQLHNRWSALARVREGCRHVREREGKAAGWMTPRWIKIQEVGLGLLYRLQDCGKGSNHVVPCSLLRSSSVCYEDQAMLIKSLPVVSLAVLLFTLFISIHQLRADGPDIIHHQSPVQVPAFRAELELACEELMLQHGADYLVSLLNHNVRATRYASCGPMSWIELTPFPECSKMNTAPWKRDSFLTLTGNLSLQH